MNLLNRIASSQDFEIIDKGGQAEMLLWGLAHQRPDISGFSAAEICQTFAEISLPRPNPTRVRERFRKSKNVRTVAVGVYAPTRKLDLQMLELFPPEVAASDLFDVSSIVMPPFVDPERRNDLARMVKVYSLLFLLENSLRGLIERVLYAYLGDDWWETAANTAMKRKHAERAQNEQTRKWAPTRAEFGPLYSIDWPDLITIIRKYPEQFTPAIKDVNFLHRYEDAGAFRNIVAHNGIMREEDDFNRIAIYYRDWIKQLS